MADRYLHNNAVGTPASPWETYGTNHAHALETFDAVALAAGETIWMASGHVDTLSAAKTYTSSANATAGNPQKLLCVTDIGTNTALSATGSGSGKIVVPGSYPVTFEGYWYIHGLYFDASTSTSNSAYIPLGSSGVAGSITMINLLLKMGTGASAFVACGPVASASNKEHQVCIHNAVYSPGNTGQTIQLRHGRIRISNLTLDAAAAATPTSIFAGASGTSPNAVIENCDLSGKAATNLYNSNASNAGIVRVVRCKLPAAIVYCTDNIAVSGFEFELVDCTQGTTHVPYYGRKYAGEFICEQTILPNATADRMALAGDTTNYHSMRLAASANASFVEPLYSPWINIPIDDTATAITPYAEILVSGDGVAAWTDREAWIEVDKMVTATYRLGTRDDDAPTVIATGTNQAAGTITWTGHGYTTPRTHKLALGSSFTPTHKGHIRVRVANAKASGTLYVGKVGVA